MALQFLDNRGVWGRYFLDSPVNIPLSFVLRAFITFYAYECIILKALN